MQLAANVAGEDTAGPVTKFQNQSANTEGQMNASQTEHWPNVRLPFLTAVL